MAPSIINNRIQNSQDVQLSLLLKQTVDDIRNELQKEYSVSVILDKIQLPCPPSNFNQEELDPLSDHGENDNEPMHDWRSDDGSDAEYSPSEDQVDIEEKSEQIIETKNTTEEEATSCDDSIDSVELKEIKAKRKSKSQTKVRQKSRTGCKQSQKKPSISKFFIPDGPNRFKYEGISFHLNDKDQTYTCDACGFRSSPTERSIREHIIRHVEKLARGIEIHYTEEEKQKLMAVQISDTEWIYRGEYKIIRVGEKLKCVWCGFERSGGGLGYLTSHIESIHVGMESADKVAPFQVTDKPSVKDLTRKYKSVPYTFYPAESKYTCGICQAKLSSGGRNIARHINELHTDAAISVTCEICGKELSNQRGYKSHMKKHRTELKNCPTCKKKFYCKKAFNRHLKIHVLGEAALKHQCKYCGIKFYSQAKYRQHVRIHTGELPYECGDCRSKFRLNTDLKHHRQKVHGVQIQKRPARTLIRTNE